MSEGKIKIHPAVKTPVYIGNGYTAEVIADNSVGYKVTDQLTGEAHFGVTVEEALGYFKDKGQPWKV